MTAYVILALLFVGFLGAAIASIADPKPLRRPREWTIGELMGQRR